MRVLAWSVLALTLTLVPAHAQTYDPRYPVCMKLYSGPIDGGEWIDCSYMSLPQCRATASGRPATCELNPYFMPPPAPLGRAHRRHG